MLTSPAIIRRWTWWAAGSTLAETQAGWLAGTPPYMAPEQLRGEPVTPATDVFALGVLLFEMACGSRPFAGRTSAELVGAILHSEPDWQRIDDDVALPGLAKLLRELLAKQPADRPSALEIAQRLKHVGQADAGTKQVRTLAVLPFADLSAARDQQYFCDGLVDELLTALAAVPELQVISRTAVGRFRESELDLKDIGERLGVEHLVEGSVRKAGDRLRVSVRLLASESGFQLWAERYNRDLEDVFAVQEEIAERIVEALAVSLGPRQRSALARSSHRAYTGDTRAYDAYLRGRALLTGFDRSDHLASARAQFESALERDSAYAPALAALARLEAETYRNVSPDRDILARADHLALAPDLAEAHTALGKVLGARYDYAGAAQRFRRAATLQPDDPVAWDELSWALGYVQPPEPLEAERAAREALRLQPDMVGAHYHLSRALLLQGRLDEAEAAVLQARELDPSFDSTHLGLAQVALARGDASRARTELSQLTRLAELPIALVVRAQVEVADDREDAAMQLLRHAVSRGYRDLAFLRQAPEFIRLREHRDWPGLFEVPS